MASISDLTLAITDLPGTGNVQIDVRYTLGASGADLESGQQYQDVCDLIGDDTPGDRSDDLIRRIGSGTTSFSGTAVYLPRTWSLQIPASELNEDDASSILSEDEIRAVVTLLPIPAKAESNLVLWNRNLLPSG